MNAETNTTLSSSLRNRLINPRENMDASYLTLMVHREHDTEYFQVQDESYRHSVSLGLGSRLETVEKRALVFPEGGQGETIAP